MKVYKIENENIFLVDQNKKDRFYFTIKTEEKELRSVCDGCCKKFQTETSLDSDDIIDVAWNSKMNPYILNIEEKTKKTIVKSMKSYIQSLIESETTQDGYYAFKLHKMFSPIKDGILCPACKEKANMLKKKIEFYDATCP